MKRASNTRTSAMKKACYTGQEIVERVRSRGHANRQAHPEFAIRGQHKRPLQEQIPSA